MLELTPPKNGVIGHRGALDCAPENTLAGFEAAALLGLTWLEFDIRLTSEDSWVIFHDENLTRLTHNSSERIRDLSVEAIRAISLLEECSIPILLEILPLLWKLGLQLNLEIKIVEKDESIALAALAPLIENWPSDKLPPYFSSFNHDLLFAIRKKYPTLPLGFLAKEISPPLIEQLKKTANVSLNLHWKNLTPETISQYKQEGLTILAYTVNNQELAQSFCQAGLFGFFTDCPKIFL